MSCAGPGSRLDISASSLAHCRMALEFSEFKRIIGHALLDDSLGKRIYGNAPDRPLTLDYSIGRLCARSSALLQRTAAWHRSLCSLPRSEIGEGAILFFEHRTASPAPRSQSLMKKENLRPQLLADKVL